MSSDKKRYGVEIYKKTYSFGMGLIEVINSLKIQQTSSFSTHRKEKIAPMIAE
jgi:hypothetical protein